jgi:hypothetical protein
MGDSFLNALMRLHEAGKKKDKGLFGLIVDSMTDDEEVFETQMLVNGDVDFRLEVEEKSESGYKEISISIYRAFSVGNVHCSLNVELDYEADDEGYRHPGDEDGKVKSMEEVYAEVMRLLKQAEKVRL